MKKVILLCLLSIPLLSISQKGKFKITSIPEWIIKKNLDQESLKDDGDQNGYYYQLLDFQTNLKAKGYFSHYSIKINNAEGVQQMSDLSIDYDPSYQELHFHKIQLIRDGEVINKLNRKNIQTIQRENSMERYLYDGSITAVVNLTDVRAGDILEYSFTIYGDNPAHQNVFSTKIYQKYGVSIGLLFHRILVPNEKKLYFSYRNQGSKPIKNITDNYTEYTWEFENLEAQLYDSYIPSWFDPYPFVSISEYKNWNQVAKQYAEYYTVKEGEKAKLKKQLHQLFSETPEDSLVNKAIKFVQNEVRYLGFEGGLNSFVPESPLKVFKQRYGDCKSKSFLLVEILRAHGYEAYPVLVNSYAGKLLNEELPSPTVFDHCIVQYKLKGFDYFVDPTYSNQGGLATSIYVPNYEQGLILKDSTEDLVAISSKVENSVRIKEEFDIEKIGGTGYFYVTSTYRGKNADSQRSIFGNSNMEKIQKSYLEYYSNLYPSIREFGKLQFKDYPSENKFVIEETYFIDSLWVKSSTDSNLLYSEFYPLPLENYFNLSHSPGRKMPFAVSFPVDIAHETIINLPESWEVSPENEKIEDDAFFYQREITSGFKNIRIKYHYKTLTDHIDAENSKSFIQKHRQIFDKLTYQLTYNLNYLPENNKTSYSLLILSILTIIFSSWGAIRLYKNYNLPKKEFISNKENIGGWLILVSFGLCLTPLRLIISYYQSFDQFFSTATFDYIFNNPEETFLSFLGSGLIIFEIIYNSAYLIFTLLLIVLFFRKRNIVPRLMILFYSISLLILILDSIFAFLIHDGLFSEAEKTQTFKDIFQSFIGAAIWIPYFIFSKRVKRTFVETYDASEMEPLDSSNSYDFQSESQI